MKVKFLPKKYIDVEICDIYENRDGVIVQHSDTLQDNTAYNVEALGFKFGIRPTAFHWAYSGIQNPLKDISRTGVMRFGVYIPSDRYRTLTGGAYLPDYSDTLLSSAGAEYYGRDQGEQKKGGYPNNGQELFEYTFGVKGYDIINARAGSEQNLDFIREMEYMDNWYMQNFGRLPSSGSDRQGKIGSKEVYMPYYMGIRSTTVSGNHSYSDMNRLSFIHRSITSRWENAFASGDFKTVNRQLADSIDTAFEVRGMFNDFTHWHRTLTQANDIYLLHDLYELIHTSVKGRNAWYAGYSQAVEYYWFKAMTKRVRASLTKDNTKILLTADFDDEYYNQKQAGLPMRLLYNRIKQPLSVKIDLTGTLFENKPIKTNYNKPLALGDNRYVIDIPFNGFNGFQQVIIQESESVDYKNFVKPKVISLKANEIITDIPVRAVLFEHGFNRSMNVIERSLNINGKHNFSDIDRASFVGIISKEGVSSLIEL